MNARNAKRSVAKEKTTPKQPKGPAGGTHSQSEDFPWTIDIGNHPKRKDSAAYVKARKLMMKIAPTTGWFYGAGPYQDHHGAALWVKDEQGWFLLKNLAGIEWSAQFCADPTKVDVLRQNAKRLYAKFPLTAKAFKEMGFDLDALLTTEIKDAAGVAKWTDSICNAGIPLGAPWHTGVLATKRASMGTTRPVGAAATAVVAGGVHHYPTPITDIQFFKRDDFRLWVTDEEDQVAAVVPTEKSDGSAEVVYATPGTKLHQQWIAQHDSGARLLLAASHPVAVRAFARPSPPAG